MKLSARFRPRLGLGLCASLLVFGAAFSMGCEDDPRDKAFLTPHPDAGSDASAGSDAAASGNDSGATTDSGTGDSGAPDTGTGNDAGGDDAGDAN